MFSGLEASLVRVRRVMRVWEDGEEDDDAADDDGGLVCSCLVLGPSAGGRCGCEEDDRVTRALLLLRSACFRFPVVI